MNTQTQQPGAAVTFTTPVGRLVQGDCFEPQTKDMAGQPLVVKSGPNKGQPAKKWFVGVAFPKADGSFNDLYAQLVAVARQAFPHLFDAQGRCTNPRFSWKFIDGDGTDDNGKPWASREGFAGHWVLRCSSGFAPKCFYKDHYAPHEQITDKNVIRRGYFVRVNGSVSGNNDAQKPGLFVNVNLVELYAHGTEITSGPDASQAFGGAPAPAALPAGATALPGMPSAPGFAPAVQMPGAPVGGPPAMPGMPAGQPPAMPGMPGGFPGAAPAGPAMGAPSGVPGTMAPPPAVPVTPHPTFTAGPGAGGVAMPGGPGVPQMPGMPAAPGVPMMPPTPPAPPAGPQLTAAAQAAWPGATLANWQAQGWSEQAMRQAGYLA